MKRYPAVLSALFDTPLLIHPGKLREIEAFISTRVAGNEVAEPVVNEEPSIVCYNADGESCELTYSELAGQHTAAAGAAIPAGNAFVAVLPLFGTMYQHGGMEMRMSGGLSTEQFGREFSSLASNPAVKSILIETHSPGGQVWGTQELADLIFSARESGKRVISVANSMMASAALWTATAASKVYVTPGGEMGSMGVVTMHQDHSKAEENEGVKTTIIAVPAAKVEGHPYAPLDEEVAARLTAEVEDTYNTFAKAMARNRGVSVEAAKANFGGGRMLSAKESVKAGLADGVATMREVLSQEVARLKSFQNRGNAGKNRRATEIASVELI